MCTDISPFVVKFSMNELISTCGMKTRDHNYIVDKCKTVKIRLILVSSHLTESESTCWPWRVGAELCRCFENTRVTGWEAAIKHSHVAKSASPWKPIQTGFFRRPAVTWQAAWRPPDLLLLYVQSCQTQICSACFLCPQTDFTETLEARCFL